IFLTQALTPSGNFPRLPATAAQNNLTEVALSGAPANHTGLPPIYNNAAFYSVFDDKVALADNPRLGQIAFRATVNDGHLDGVFAGLVPTGSMVGQQQVPMGVVAQDQQAAPIPASAGIPNSTGATFVGFFNTVPISNSNNPLVAFQANTSVASGLFGWTPNQ